MALHIGDVYIFTAMAWLWIVDRVTPTVIDVAGVATIAVGCGLLIVGSLNSPSTGKDICSSF